MSSPPAAAYFITPHGFGHATRAAAIIQAAQALRPELRFEIFGSPPPYLFAPECAGRLGFHPCAVDVGLAQHDPLRADLPETLRRLGELLPFRPELVQRLAAQVTALGCRVVVCDIAPLGIAVAQAAGLPSVLVENFTWDWIYAGYQEQAPTLLPFTNLLELAFRQASYHIQTEPVCLPDPGASLVVGPVSRLPALPAETVRASLGIPAAARLVLVTVSGSANGPEMFERLPPHADFFYIFSSAQPHIRRGPDRLLLPAGFYYPDIVRASAACAGKVGYSSIAEAACAGLPFVYIRRPGFRESPVLERFIDQELGGFEMAETDLMAGGWLPRLAALLDGRAPRPQPNGAAAAAGFVLGLPGLV